jgi:hypothetical protein
MCVWLVVVCWVLLTRQTSLAAGLLMLTQPCTLQQQARTQLGTHLFFVAAHPRLACARVQAPDHSMHHLQHQQQQQQHRGVRGSQSCSNLAFLVSAGSNGGGGGMGTPHNSLAAASRCAALQCRRVGWCVRAGCAGCGTAAAGRLVRHLPRLLLPCSRMPVQRTQLVLWLR